MNKSKVVVITINYNQNQYTLDCIDSLLKSCYENFQVLLVDNGSNPHNVVELEKKLHANSKILLHKIATNCGYIGGINYGLEKGGKLLPDYFLIMNNDTFINKYAIAELVDTCNDYQNKAIISGKIYHYDDKKRLQYIGGKLLNNNTLKYEKIGLNQIDEGQYNKIEERDMLDDIFWLFPFDLYKEIGGYSPYFWFNAEQADYALRAKKIGYKLIYTPKAKLWHKGSVTIGGRDENPALVYWNIQSALIFRYLHLPKLKFLFFYLIIIKGIFKSYLKMTFNYILGRNFSFKYTYAQLRALLYFDKWVIKKNINTGKNPF